MFQCFVLGILISSRGHGCFTINPPHRSYQISLTWLWSTRARVTNFWLQLKKAAAKRKSQFLMDSYRQVRNKVNVLNIQQKKQYYTNKISACQGNMKESWKAINEILNKRSKSSNIDCLKESGSETVHKKIFRMQ